MAPGTSGKRVGVVVFLLPDHVETLHTVSTPVGKRCAGLEFFLLGQERDEMGNTTTVHAGERGGRGAHIRTGGFVR